MYTVYNRTLAKDHLAQETTLLLRPLGISFSYMVSPCCSLDIKATLLQCSKKETFRSGTGPEFSPDVSKKFLQVSGRKVSFFDHCIKTIGLITPIDGLYVKVRL